MRTSPHWWASTFVEEFKRDLKDNQGVDLTPMVESHLFAESLKLIQEVARDAQDDLQSSRVWRAS